MLIDQSHTKIIIPWSQFSAFIAALPLFSFASCVFVAVVWHFDEATRTHCKVPNYLPSISAAIGGKMPEKFIWNVGIALHCLPRIVLAPLVSYKHFKSTQSGRNYHLTTWWFKRLNLLVSTLHVVENGALLTLTYVSSLDNLGIHEGSFKIFMACAVFYMCLSCFLFKLTATRPMSPEEVTVFRKRIFIMLFNYCSFSLAVYCYFRHNEHCEPGMYTVFALCEYCTVVSNIVFHWYCQQQFKGGALTVSFGDIDQSKRS